MVEIKWNEDIAKHYQHIESIPDAYVFAWFKEKIATTEE